MKYGIIYIQQCMWNDNYSWKTERGWESWKSICNGDTKKPEEAMSFTSLNDAFVYKSGLRDGHTTWYYVVEEIPE